MGGLGSGWHRGFRTTVEECRVLSASKLTEAPRRAGVSTWIGNLTWPPRARILSRIEFTLGLYAHVGTAHLRYAVPGAANGVDYTVHLTTTPLAWGGVRWWLRCPLVIGGRPCRRRVGKLYLPPGQRHFGCRDCYRLTYTSCQEAHRFDAVLGLVGAYMTSGASSQLAR